MGGERPIFTLHNSVSNLNILYFYNENKLIYQDSIDLAFYKRQVYKQL